MRRPMKKSMRLVLGLLLVAALTAACFFSVALYAGYERQKPKFTLPEQPLTLSRTTLTDDPAAVFADVSRLYSSVSAAHNVEGSWRTEVHTDGDWDLPFSDADNAALRYIAGQASEQCGALYPSASNVVMAQAADVPKLPFTAADIMDCTVQRGQTTDDGVVADPDVCRVVFAVDPACIRASSIPDGTVCQSILQTMSDALTVERLQIIPTDVSACFDIDRLRDQLTSVRIAQTYRIEATIRLRGAYAALSSEPVVDVTLPYESVLTMEFMHYGAWFTQRAVAVNPGDQKTLPAQVFVSSAVKREDYSLSFAADRDGVLSFNDDGVMSVLQVCDEPVTVTMKLLYQGCTYSDTITVYVTPWEVTDDAQ